MPSIQSVTATVLLSLATSLDHASGQSDRPDYVSEASRILGSYTLRDEDHSPEAMAAAANRLLSLLDDELRQRAAHPRARGIPTAPW